MVTKQGRKMVTALHFKEFSGSSLECSLNTMYCQKALGATSLTSFAAILIRRCLRSFNMLPLEKPISPRPCRKRLSQHWSHPVALHA